MANRPESAGRGRRWGVVGAGAWGTALAWQLARAGRQVQLWGRRPPRLAAAGDATPPAVVTALEPLVQGCSRLIIAVPSHALLEVAERIAPMARGDEPMLLLASKGLVVGPEGPLLLHDALAAVPALTGVPVALLSGPSFAGGVLHACPTALTLAAERLELAEGLAAELRTERFRIYATGDRAGVAVAGAAKNVLAVAVGASDGMGLGANARAALITRGLAELTRLGLALGAQPETLMGLAGVGDLVLTCSDDQSRNRRFGMALGRGADVAAARREVGALVEAERNAAAVLALAGRHGVDMPIVEQVVALIDGEVSAPQAVQALLERAPRPELGALH